MEMSNGEGGESAVRLTPPKNVTWTLALLLLLLGVLAKQMPLPLDLSAYAFWLVGASSVLLVIACLFKGI